MIIRCPSLALFLASCLLASVSYGQRFTGTTELLRNAQIRKELELVDYQVKELDALLEASRQRPDPSVLAALRNLTNLPQKERMASFLDLRAQLQTRVNEIQKRINDVLLPRQQKRLHQIRVQLQFRRYGSAVTLADKGLATELGMTDKQQRELRQFAQERSHKLNDEIKQLRANARREVLEKVLTKTQIKELDDLLGEQFELTLPSRAGFGTGELSDLKGSS